MGRPLSAMLGRRRAWRKLSEDARPARIRRLERESYILGHKAIFSPVKLGLEHVAFAEVKLSDTRAKALN